MTLLSVNVIYEAIQLGVVMLSAIRHVSQVWQF